MSDTIASIDRIVSGKRAYERLVWGLVAVGCLGLFAGVWVEERLVGTLIYLVAVWIAIVVAFGLPYLSEQTLEDERDTALHNRASGVTIGIAFVVSVSVVPALYVLDAGGVYSISATLWGVIYAISVLAILYGVSYIVMRYRF